MKKFWLIEKVDVICTMPSGGTLPTIQRQTTKKMNIYAKREYVKLKIIENT